MKNNPDILLYKVATTSCVYWCLKNITILEIHKSSHCISVGIRTLKYELSWNFYENTFTMICLQPFGGWSLKFGALKGVLFGLFQNH